MSFKVKDLLITVLPDDARGALFPFPNFPFAVLAGPCTPCSNCTDCSNCTGCSACTGGCTGCSFCTNATAVAPEPGLTGARRAQTAESLALVKKQLQQALAEVEAREREIEESMRPATLEELDQLEQKLTEALAELKQRRAKLEGPPAGEP